jgi:hypothetical protein
MKIAGFLERWIEGGPSGARRTRGNTGRVSSALRAHAKCTDPLVGCIEAEGSMRMLSLARSVGAEESEHRPPVAQRDRWNFTAVCWPNCFVSARFDADRKRAFEILCARFYCASGTAQRKKHDQRGVAMKTSLPMFIRPDPPLSTFKVACDPGHCLRFSCGTDKCGTFRDRIPARAGDGLGSPAIKAELRRVWFRVGSRLRGSLCLTTAQRLRWRREVEEANWGCSEPRR